MAILWADNFQNYGTSAARLQDGLYINITGSTRLSTDPDPTAAGTRVLELINDDRISFPLPTGSVSTTGFSFRYWSTLPVGSAHRFGLLTSGLSPQAEFGIIANGSIRAFRGSAISGTQLSDTNVPVITPNSWNHVEAKFVIDDIAGSIEIRVNGITVLNVTGQDTRNVGTELGAVVLLQSSQGSRMYIKDFIVWDTSGSVNNNFLGSCAVVTLLPDSDDTFTWAPSTGVTGWNLIDETTPNDADFISAADPPPAPSTFGLTNLPPDIVAVKALLPVTRSRKIDGGDGNLQVGLKGTLTDLGGDKPITTAFTYRWDVSELSPDTGAAWTPVEVDAVKLQVNRTL